MMGRLLVGILLLAATGLGMALTVKTYHVRDKLSGSDVFWKEDRCVVVVGANRYGLQTTLLGSLLEELKARVNAVGRRPTDQASAIAVFTITSAGVDEKRAPFPYSQFEVMGGTLYSRLGGFERALWRWTGTSFEKATADQEGALSRTPAPVDFDNRDGWSKRHDPFHRSARVEMPVRIDGRVVTLLFQYDGARDTLVLMDGQNRKLLVSLDETPRTVDGSSYASEVRSGPAVTQATAAQ
jgi:hypothetical protein